MVKKKQEQPGISNRRARHDYDLIDSYVVGISLLGSEVKALRMNRGNLTGAYVTIQNGELWLINALVTTLPSTNLAEDEQTRSRKLLAKRSEIEKLTAAKQQGYTILPLELLTKGKFIKLRIAPGRGKKHFDKRETLKKRDITRELQKSIKLR